MPIEFERPLMLHSTVDRSARLLVERAMFGSSHIDGIRLTCIADESDRCQGIFLRPSETVPLIVGLLDRLSQDSIRVVLEAAHARYMHEARRDAEWFVSRDRGIDRAR